MSPDLLAPEQFANLKEQIKTEQEATKQHYLWLIDTFKNDKDIYRILKMECKILNKGVLKRGEIKALAKYAYHFILDLKYHK